VEGLGVAVLGAGFMGRTHVQAWSRIAGARVVAVAGRRASAVVELANSVAAQAYFDLSEAIAAPGVDVVDVALPTRLHAPVAIAALKAGRSVIVEKPMALSLDDADAMRRAAEHARKPLLVGHVVRFWPAYQTAHDLVRAGRIGEIRAIAGVRLSAPASWAGWFADPAQSGGAIIDLQVHEIDVMNWLAGLPHRVSSTGRRGRTGGWDHVMTILDYGDVPAVIEVSSCMPTGYPFTTSIRIDGTTGTLSYRSVASGAGIETLSGDGGVVLTGDGALPVEIQPRAIDPFESELRTFLRAIETGERDGASATAGRQALLVALASLRSLETGAAVNIGDSGS
jgi:UDP-N-acetylglucosamine 3-dehydrogenase